MKDLIEIEEIKGLKFPKIYKIFYERCEKSIPKEMVGSDLYNNYKELNEWAKELLKEDNVENFLSEKDFIFMMHQGYMFWYFKADGNEDPDVYFYHEMELMPKRICSLEYFINNYPKI
jgi:hypothetical protein